MYYTYSENLISDLHKDAYGVRPTDEWMQRWSNATSNEKQVIWDDLVKYVDIGIQNERNSREKNFQDFIYEISNFLIAGAKDEKEAIKEYLSIQNFSETELRYGAEHVAYLLNLDVDVINELPIQDAIDEILSEPKMGFGL